MMHDITKGRPPVVLVRQYVGRMLDVSSGGCLIEIGTALPIGAVGRLEAEIAGSMHVEAARVVRVHNDLDTAAHVQIALEFLPVTIPSTRSIRAALSQLADRADFIARFVH